MQFSRNRFFLIEIRRGLGKSEVPEVEEIGDGLLAVRWPREEHFNIFFDTGRWRLTIVVKESYRDRIFPPQLTNTGFLPGTSFSGGMKTSTQAWVIVRQKLVPTASHYKLITDVGRRAYPYDFGGMPEDIFKDIFKDLQK